MGSHVVISTILKEGFEKYFTPEYNLQQELAGPVVAPQATGLGLHSHHRAPIVAKCQSEPACQHPW